MSFNLLISKQSAAFFIFTAHAQITQGRCSIFWKVHEAKGTPLGTLEVQLHEVRDAAAAEHGLALFALKKVLKRLEQSMHVRLFENLGFRSLGT